jgi:hypothetical protein
METILARGAATITEGPRRMDDRTAARTAWFDVVVAERIDASYRLATVILDNRNRQGASPSRSRNA